MGLHRRALSLCTPPRFALLFVASSVGACTLLTDLDGVGGGGAPAGDAGQSAEASSDASSSDGSTLVPASDAGSNWCATQDASFCDDFDLDTTLPGSWTKLEISQGDLRVVGDPGARSGPNVLSARAMAGQNSEAVAVVVKTFDAMPTKVRLVYDFRLDSTEVLPFTILPTVELANGTTALSISAGLIETSTFLNEYVEYQDGGPSDGTGREPASTGIPVGKWVHVEMGVVLGGAITLTIDGVALQARTMRSNPPPPTNGKLTLYVGLYRDGTTPVSGSFDNVAITYE